MTIQSNTVKREIIKLASLYTYEEVGSRFGISKQRVHQIFRSYKTLSNLKLKKELLAQPCLDCEAKAVHIHHSDRNSSNNNKSNLIPVCQSCHLKRHKILRRNTIQAHIGV